MILLTDRFTSRLNNIRANDVLSKPVGALGSTTSHRDYEIYIESHGRTLCSISARADRWAIIDAITEGREAIEVPAKEPFAMDRMEREEEGLSQGLLRAQDECTSR